MINLKIQRRIRRRMKIRAKVFGSNDRPRISVFRSNKFIYAQAIDDKNGKTLASYSSAKLKEKTKITKTESAKSVGLNLAAELKKIKIDTVVFDRGGYLYKGRVEAVADGLREGGIKV